uniref:Ig-like domain-containing protein n=1 Tax=Ursus americanus TaxID=9643 RepID=A0A452QT45_URSAM
MEPPSAPPRGGHVPWQELLLAVSLLTFWNPPTTAQLTVESVPPNAAEGKDVLLRVHNLPGDLLGCNWFRGETANTSHQILSYVVDTQVTTPGPAHSGRETIYPNGSLLFQRVTLNDTGNYTLQIVMKNAQVEQGTGEILVFSELPKPIITSNNSDPLENADPVVLTCEPQTQSTSYLWSVNRKSLPVSARLQLSLDNRTLTIHRVTRNDTGPYECGTQNPVSAGRSDPFTLNVLCLPVGSIIGIAVGVLVALALTVALGCLLLRTRIGRYDGISHTLILSCSRPLARRRPHTDQGFWTGYSRPPNYPLEFPVSFPLAPSSAAVDRGASFTCSLVIH